MAIESTGKPVIYDENNETRIMYPNEARLRKLQLYIYNSFRCCY